MPQFDVHRNTGAEGRKRAPFVVVMQGDFLSDLQTRIAAPLVLADRFGTPVTRLNPTFRVADRIVVLSVGELAAIDRRELGEPVGSLATSRDDIIAALDFLFTGI
ncbi:MAG: CcdB family protein [Alphaproteobacteria bacterium]|nr:CcdB family protein [Alphaproteobacteria bacterium]